MAGEFCWSLTITDVHTQWTETRAVANRSQHVVQGAIAAVEAEELGAGGGTRCVPWQVAGCW